MNVKWRVGDYRREGDGNVIVYRRLTRGRGDAIMMRPALISSIRNRPTYRHVVHITDFVAPILEDIEGLEIVPITGSEADDRLRKSDELLKKHYSPTVYELSAPALSYELVTQPNVALSRQEIYCMVVGQSFTQGDYAVKFTDEELSFADGFINDEICIGVHFRSAEPTRDYRFIHVRGGRMKIWGLVDLLAKRFDGKIVVVDPERYVGSRINVINFWERDIRKAWAVMSRMALGIGVDSFGVHAWGSTGVPVYGLFGPTDPGRRLLYKNAEWSPKSSCKRQYCWYKPCFLKRNSRPFVRCLNSRTPLFYFRDIERKFPNILSGGRRVVKPLRQVKSSVKSCVIVRLRGIGDVLMTFPAIATFKSVNGKVKVDYITSIGCADLVRAWGKIDRVICCDYDHSAEGTPDVPSGIDYSCYDKVFNLINKVDFVDVNIAADEVPRIELFAKCLGLNGVDKSSEWKMAVPPSWLRRGRELLESYRLGNRKLLALQVDSNGRSRRWPVYLQQEFIRLANRAGFKVMLLGIEKEGRYPSYVIDFVGKLSVIDYVAMIALSDIFIGPDSSGVHIAGTIGKKAIGLYGSVDPNLRISHYDTVYPMVGKSKCLFCNDWQLFNCEHEKPNLRCMRSIKPGDVIKLSKKLVER